MNNYLEEALALYRDTVARFPDDLVSRTGLAETLKSMGDLEEALAIQRETLSMFPDDIVTRNGFAETLKEMGRLVEALDIQQETIRLFAQEPLVRVSLADTMARLGRLDEAITAYQETITQYPNDPVIRNGLAELLRRTATTNKDELASSPHQSRYRYQVALSFAGEDRAVAKKLASLLKSQGLSVFYDEYAQAELWGKDLYQHLAEVYKESAQYCIVILSEHYARKLWTKHELKQMQARAFKENREYILPVRLDDTEIPSLSETAGYLDLRQISVESVVKHTIDKIRTSLT